MSSHSVPSSGPNGLRVTTTSTLSPVIGSNLLYASSASLSMWWNVMVRSSLQRGMQAANLVEPGQERLQRLAVGQRGVEVAGTQFVLLGIEVLLAALADRSVLEQLVAGVHAPCRAHRGGQRRADREHSRPAVLQALVQDVGGVDAQVLPGCSRRARRSDSPNSVSSHFAVRQVKYV